MMNRKEFKNLLTEWKNLINNNLLLEISRDEVIEVIGEDDYNILKNNKKASQDQNFLKVIINTYQSDQAHSLDDILGLYQDYESSIKNKWYKKGEAIVNVPGGFRIKLTPDITIYNDKDDEPKTTTYNDVKNFLEARSDLNLNSSIFIECLSQGDINPDFEVILNDDEWIICYPKTIKGSISLARSFWNGERLEYDTTVKAGVGDNIGAINWCTSIVPKKNKPSGNMFLNYHRQANLHMYYCIKKNMNVQDLDRKLCISFFKKDSTVGFKGGNASVNGNNQVTDEKNLRSYIGSRFNDLIKDAEKPERLEIDPISYYESVNFEQYKILKAANQDNIELFASELENILMHSMDAEKIVNKDLVHEDNKVLRNIAIKSRHLNSENISDLLKTETDQKIIDGLISNENCPFDKIKALPENKHSVNYYKILVSNSACPPDVLNTIIKDEYDYKVKLEFDFLREEIQYNACLSVIKYSRFSELDEEAQEIMKEVLEEYIQGDFTSAVEYFYDKVDEGIRKKDQSVYTLFFSYIEFENIDYVARGFILRDKLLPEAISNKFFEKILPPDDPYGYVTDDLDIDYIDVINHDKLPVELFENIYNLASKSSMQGLSYYLELAKNKRTPDDVLKKLILNKDSEVRKEAKNNLESRNPLTIAAEKAEEDELITMSVEGAQRQKVDIVKRKDLSKFDIETTRIVLRNIIEEGKIRPKFMKFLSERDDLVDLGLEPNDLQIIYDNLRSEFDKNAFAAKYPDTISQYQNLTGESLLRDYIKRLL